jgi:type VI protein secretion system component VasK
VILTNEVDSVLDKEKNQALRSRGRMFNERLQIIRSVVGKDLPVYVLFTKSDSFPYFREFFAHLSESESRQPLGVTIPLEKPEGDASNTYVEREGKRLTALFRRLNLSIADKRLVFLAREDIITIRGLAYEFPREFKKASDAIVQFLLDIFRPTTLNDGCVLRGFYFTGERSVIRENASLDATDLNSGYGKERIDATRLLNPDRSPPNGPRTLISNFDVTQKWAFMSGVFQDVIFPDPIGRIENAYEPNRLNQRTVFALAALGITGLVLSVIWVNSWRNNRELLKGVQAAVVADETYESQGANLAELESIRPQLQTLSSYARTHPPLSYRWGLYSGDQAEGALRALYFARFREVMLQPSLDAMTQLFLSLEPKSSVHGDVYKLLKSYVTITSGACPPDEKVIAPTVFQMWESVASPTGADQAVAEAQARFYSSELTISDPYKHSLSANRDALERARSYLLDWLGPDKILQALLREAGRDRPPERLSDYATNYGLVISGPNDQPADYTRATWIAVQDSIHGHKLSSAGEACVIGSSTSTTSVAANPEMESEVQKLYLDTYKRQWKDYLTAHHIIPFTDTLDGAQKLRTLADNNRSPLLALIYMVSTNTNMAVEESSGERIQERLKSTASGAKQQFDAITSQIGRSSKDTGSPKDAGGVKAARDMVYAQFEPVRIMVDSQDRDKLLNDKNQPYMKGLENLSAAIAGLPAQVHMDVPMEMQELQQAKAALDGANSALHSLSGLFPSTPEGIDIDLTNLLREPIDFANKVIRNVAVIKPAPATVAASGLPPSPSAAAPSAPDISGQLRLKATIARVNQVAQNLCAVSGAIQQKFPFDANSPEDATMDELNQVLAPGTGAYFQFSASTDVAKSFLHQNRTWAGRSEFQATYSPVFLSTLNSLGEIEETLYGDGSTNPHFDYTVTVDGTGKIPFELDVDGHVIKFQPGKVTPPAKLVWPPVTDQPAQLKVISKNGQSTQRTGPWGFIHLLQDADEHNGNVFTFRTVQFAHGLNPLKSDKGVAGTIQIRIDSPAIAIFTRGYYSKLHCLDSWALQPQNSSE